MKFFKINSLIIVILFILPYSLSMAYEEPNYEVIQKNEIYEVRKYSDRLAVETIDSGSENNFRKLFNYISGRNKNNEKIKTKMLSYFDVLGFEHESTILYRKKLSRIMFS